MESISLHKLSAGNDCQKLNGNAKRQACRFFFRSFRKRWLLFPPDSPLGQLQTRIPYEESSVYIDVEPTWMQKFQVGMIQWTLGIE